MKAFSITRNADTIETEGAFTMIEVIALILIIGVAATITITALVGADRGTVVPAGDASVAAAPAPEAIQVPEPIEPVRNLAVQENDIDPFEEAPAEIAPQNTEVNAAAATTEPQAMITPRVTKVVNNGGGNGSYSVDFYVDFNHDLSRQSAAVRPDIKLSTASNMSAIYGGDGAQGLNGWFAADSVPVSSSTPSKRSMVLTYTTLSGVAKTHNVYFETSELSLAAEKGQPIKLYSSDAADTLPLGVTAR